MKPLKQTAYHEDVDAIIRAARGLDRLIERYERGFSFLATAYTMYNEGALTPEQFHERVGKILQKGHWL